MCVCLCAVAGGDPPALASVRVHTRVLALTWLSPAEQQLDLEGRSLLAVLHEYAGTIRVLCLSQHSGLMSHMGPRNSIQAWIRHEWHVPVHRNWQPADV